MSIIEVKNISKEFKIQIRENGIIGQIKSLFCRKYEIKKAVKNISFRIDEGEIVGYIGPNGAGKSTTIKMLVGIVQPTEGEVLINGINPYENRKDNAKNMGVVFGQRSQLWWDIPLKESIMLMKYMYNVPDDEFDENLKFYTDVLELNEFINIPVRQLSLGQRMRAEICVALLHNPKLLYLDEPTIGLDVVVKEKIRNAIKKINKEKKVTVILTTHDMSDIEKLCDRVMVVDSGHVIYDGKIGKLISQYGNEEKMSISIGKDSKLLRSKLKELDIEVVDYNDGIYNIIYDSNSINSAQIINWFVKNDCDIKNFTIEKMGIEEVIRKVYLADAKVSFLEGINNEVIFDAN